MQVEHGNGLKTNEQEDGPEGTTAKVAFQMDGKEKRILRGEYSVSDFKRMMEIAASEEIDEVVDGTLKALKDDDRIVIKERKIFVSHKRKGGSS